MSAYFKNYYEQRKEHYTQLNKKARRRWREIWGKRLAKLKNRPCTDCGKSYPYYCMDFDHLDPETKVADISMLFRINASEKRLLAEIEKAEVVCANCHRGREHKRYIRSGKIPVHLSPRQKKNKEIIERAKSCPCRDCGEKFLTWQMDFDHVKESKLDKVGRIAICGTTEALLAEISKCEVVCAVCHRIRTFFRKIIKNIHVSSE